ncbi:tRNA (N6-isopentenyl adenosine(37)-C2)-methylthiotransferase MiaB [Candidatus Roizmanbacteria bacterium CG22_combo_CG10-13_8_21_14_all_38_20]|uniref:tRNA-2-methylthio-N(6)-dimethylallyladenosine synthase n=1 Tax=Candidatus Roizmanbacteria bacterium CG22_combo_CG10-13_8_21_14_all_38_20 TaxID=1974862 RepID=A0A2H0BWQ6_9BACT|nr:MiaB/RimO family radical SAM methylthiotransferase [Candidatus Microgenomates bacterium]PIP62115.1 MAG: tRNA (N6-isopentenyl adenosine(37)-C2)-methylthiotransferase MiaB [Candidatus Roizmanbacteria bacterium CG22_combo_CG10-13_8_21_14_all_38_20]PJC31841.1 MAG: tRNA (N6-isopentenyl adenosine(37)-C2)-methylthiotransferase MiaB [Candidatus Roizmanbacteria bacterium CG_4_9_14_0_2_um_filter_38_17]
MTKYHIHTFGCQQNEADSERIASQLKSRGMVQAKDIKQADHIIINTCMIRESAENRVYGLVHNLYEEKQKGRKLKVVITGCMVGMAVRDKTGEFLETIKRRMPGADEFLPIEEVGFDHDPIRTNAKHGWVPISNGCNNFCTFCVVPYTRGREISRPFDDILNEVKRLAKSGYDQITLLGMNVNSYGADIVKSEEVIIGGRKVSPVMVKHLGRQRIPTLFPYLLEEVCKVKGIKKVDFVSSNPWDFSDALIDVIAKNPKISRLIHLPVQAGNDELLQKMNRWYTKEEYINLIAKIRSKVKGVEFSTDIIVGFCGETKKQFEDTLDLVKKVGFVKAYISRYSDRPLTAAHTSVSYKDTVLNAEKKRRWLVLENLINKPNL